MILEEPVSTLVILISWTACMMIVLYFFVVQPARRIKIKLPPKSYAVINPVTGKVLIRKRQKRRGLSEPAQIIMTMALLLVASVGFIIEYNLNSNEVAAGYAFLFLLFSMTTLVFFFWRLRVEFKK